MEQILYVILITILLQVLALNALQEQVGMEVNVQQFAQQNLNGTVQSALAFLVSISFRTRAFLVTLTVFTVLQLKLVYVKMDSLVLLVSVLLVIVAVPLVQEQDL
jgi:hypothetical protein